MARHIPSIFLSLLLLIPCAAPAQEPGIYADFSTDLGDFTARLDYERAPKAVAAFVGLATGEKTWLDAFGNVRASTPFYDGTIFHRVLPGLAVQGGAVPVPACTWTETNNGPLAFQAQNGSFTIEIPPGGATNTLDELAFVFTNAPSIPTNVSFGGIASDLLQTNRTLQQIWMLSQSSCVLGTIIQTNIYRDEQVANPTLSPTVTECTIPLDFFLPNPTDAPLVYTNAISLRWVSTNSIALLGAPVATNFSNAGFYYPDAFSNGLVHAAGALAMAHNSLANTDGSQFFLCATDAPEWDGNYTVFGQVVSGMDIVASLASVEVDTNNFNRPANDVLLRSVTIRRVGADAQAFDIHAQKLPCVDNLPVGLSFGTTQVVASIGLPAQAEVAFRQTSDLLAPAWTAWQSTDWGYRPDAAATNVVLPSSARSFLHASAVTYPEAWTLPETQRGRSFTFRWTSEDPETVERIEFSDSVFVSGTWTRTTTNTLSGEVYSAWDEWYRLPYSAKLVFQDSQMHHIYTLRWDPGKTEGSFTGLLGKSPVDTMRYPISGTFTLDDSP